MIDYNEVSLALDEADDHNVIADNYMSVARLLRACRNDLCVKCGRYEEAHKGACKDCRWRDE